MNNILNTIGLPGTVVAFGLLVVGIIALFRLYINRQAHKALSMNKAQVNNHLVKKYRGADTGKFRGIFFNLGLILSLGFVLALFEYKDYDKAELMVLTGERIDFDEMQEVPPTEQKPPPPPKVRAPEIVEVPNEEEIQEEIEVDLDMEADEETIVEEVQMVIEEEPVVEEEAEEIFEIVEESAAFKGGIKAFYQYVGDNLKYPRKALNMQVSGKVYVQFVVDKDGTITDVKTIRGIGYGCDEEAERVLRISPKWKAGKQRGKAVKQRMVIPISFKLADI
ncbi:energy transducer TonB [Flammeovirgaceae bacterium SG7u.111]|nr:energy transducer TonB [Flammeovirgaceae bacterium SG7u.132]WPO36060.1 energy transducer TonB [Flammeovirgaceae bacterium SG7u.111]